MHLAVYLTLAIGAVFVLVLVAGDYLTSGPIW